MKKLMLLAIGCFFLTGCATVSHKDIETTWSGFGVDVGYTSTVAIPPEKIPAFITAVTKLERLIDKLEKAIEK